MLQFTHRSCTIECDVFQSTVSNIGSLSAMQREIKQAALLVYRKIDHFDDIFSSVHTMHFSLYDTNEKSRGMQNLGNSCYFNSVVQSLFHCVDF